ncbi:MAG: hypothetical protein NTV63_01675 [Candidatus Woesearchaeota archaeon]|nr:hypothetical protein [Candidatus Woesearchaeota archaeon]
MKEFWKKRCYSLVWYVEAGLYLWELFRLWGFNIFVLPFKNTDMLWILVPIWLSWFFAEFFQEKLGTSMGNAITNATVVLWGSIDSARQTVRLIIAREVTGFLNTSLRFGIISLILIYSIALIVLGLKGNTIIRKIGRIREVTYVFAIFIPIFYGAIDFSWQYMLSAVIFFPLFYYVIELFDLLTPDPKAVAQDMEEQVEYNRKKNGDYSSSLESRDLQPNSYSPPQNNYQNQYPQYPNQQRNPYQNPYQGSRHQGYPKNPNPPSRMQQGYDAVERKRPI